MFLGKFNKYEILSKCFEYSNSCSPKNVNKTALQKNMMKRMLIMAIRGKDFEKMYQEIKIEKKLLKQ